MSLFFAVWPDPESARALAAIAVQLAAQTGGKAVPESKIHLTLAFLGPVGEEGRAAVLDAANVRARPFELALDQIGSFRRAGVAWAGSSQPPEPLLRLQAKLEKRLRERGFQLDARAFTPHVTLARRTLRPARPAAIDTIQWQSAQLTLVRSESGTGRYSIEERWALER